MSPKPSRLRRALITGGLVAGSSLGAAGIATAATSPTTTPASGSATSPTPAAGSQATPPAGSTGDPATMSHGPNETLLTGNDLQSATAAATAAVPGATIIRAETNSSGASPYEVHMKKTDGTDVTVELNSSFGVITTISGFGAGPANSQVPSGTPSSSGPTY
jgi:hypothetical protein